MNRVVRYFLCAFLFSFSVFAHAEWYKAQWPIMGTSVSAEIWADTEEQGESALALVKQEMQRVESWLSPYIEESELSQVNRQAGQQPVVVTPEFLDLIKRALHYSQLSQGAFDISFASVGKLYDYRESVQPSKKALKNKLSAVNYHHIIIDENKQTIFFKHAGVSIDLGGIAKGYAVDRCMALLEKAGIVSGIVSAGGDSRVMGYRSSAKQQQPWMVGIRHPRKDNAHIARLPLVNEAISTSGDYERFFIDEKSKQRLHHILNPVTGESARDVSSATVIGPNGIDTDALSTTLFVLGIERGLALVNQLPEFEAVMIDAQGKLHYSEGLLRAVE